MAKQVLIYIPDELVAALSDLTGPDEPLYRQLRYAAAMTCIAAQGEKHITRDMAVKWLFSPLESVKRKNKNVKRPPAPSSQATN